MLFLLQWYDMLSVQNVLQFNIVDMMPLGED